jgi:F-type H+-transporting ATPase subunit epsilon
MRVMLVTPERQVWSGDADMVIARTTDGEIGVLPGHEPVLAALAPGVVRIDPAGDEPEIRAAVHGGFLSVTADGVSLLAEVAEMSNEIDPARASEALQRAHAEGDVAGARRAESRLRAAGRL